MTPEALTAFLQQEIPLTAAMQLRVTQCGEGRLRIAAPLDANRNPHGTVFGGSLATLGIVAGWTLLYVELQAEQLHPNLVIQHYDCDYLAPGTATFFAEAQLPEDWPRFIEQLRAGRRSRLDVAVRLTCEDREILTARARYAALP
ncbi:aconitase [Solimonas aquatica]|uniref:Aconitase n=1 Tax=Solimonas aquatica TaxID=489703 RepID=A0A1H9KS81_9GAMM|nr:YiiD C-terminal domain-containing protein [Solimonas aquatica]SER02026.1 aconitase [Solimonas aquatica]